MPSWHSLSTTAVPQSIVGPVPPNIGIVAISPKARNLMIRAEIIEAQVKGSRTQAQE